MLAEFSQGNNLGKLMGPTQALELGEIETPNLLTNTLSVQRQASLTGSATDGQRRGAFGKRGGIGNQ
jgi:L-aminopeptidase/D-esterase-like protein